MENQKVSSIYMILCKTTGKCYIGSTELEIQQRFGLHKTHYKRWLNSKAHYISSVECFKNNNASVMLLEIVDLTKSCVKSREKFYIQSFPNSVNKNIPFDSNDSYSKYYYNKKNNL